MEIGVVLDCSPQFDREAEYVFHTILESLGVAYAVYHGDTAVRRVERPACDVIFYHGLEDDPRRHGDGFLVKILVARRRESVLLQKWYWPRSNDFALFVSHDVELVPKRSITKELAGAARQMLRFKPRNAIADVVRTLNFNRTRRKPLWSFSDLVRLETKHSFSSSFYCSAVSGESFPYDVREETMSAALRELRRSGFEVGLRGSDDSCFNASLLREQKRSPSQ